MMNWECKEFKITKYLNEENYKNGKAESIESHHGNAITNNGLFAMWVLATGTSDTIEETMNTQQSGSYPLDPGTKVKPFTVGQSQIAIGKGNTPVSGNEKTLVDAQGYDPLSVESIVLSLDKDNNVASMTLKATSPVGNCKGEWNEWGIYDAPNGILFNRKVESMGNKSDTSIWTIEVTINLTRPVN